MSTGTACARTCRGPCSRPQSTQAEGPEDGLARAASCGCRTCSTRICRLRERRRPPGPEEGLYSGARRGIRVNVQEESSYVVYRDRAATKSRVATSGYPFPVIKIPWPGSFGCVVTPARQRVWKTASFSTTRIQATSSANWIDWMSVCTGMSVGSLC